MKRENERAVPILSWIVIVLSFFRQCSNRIYHWHVDWRCFTLISILIHDHLYCSPAILWPTSYLAFINVKMMCSSTVKLIWAWEKWMTSALHTFQIKNIGNMDQFLLRLLKYFDPQRRLKWQTQLIRRPLNLKARKVKALKGVKVIIVGNASRKEVFVNRMWYYVLRESAAFHCCKRSCCWTVPQLDWYSITNYSVSSYHNHIW